MKLSVLSEIYLHNFYLSLDTPTVAKDKMYSHQFKLEVHVLD